MDPTIVAGALIGGGLIMAGGAIGAGGLKAAASPKFGSYRPGPAGVVRGRSKGGRPGEAPKFKGRRKPR